MIRLLSLLVVLLVSVASVFGQPQTLGWVLNNPTPQYKLSGDETRLAFFDLTENDKVWAKVLDLNSWQWSQTPILNTMRLAADNKSGYQVWQNMDGRKAEGEWAGYKKYVTNVYTDVAGGTMKRFQWPDQNLALASMPDGSLLAADKVSFHVDKSSGYWRAKLRGLKIVALPAGTLVRSLRPDLTLELNVDDLPQGRTVTPDGKWLIWPAYGDWIDAIPLEGGETRRIAVPHAGVQGYAGQYLVSVGRLNSFQGFRDTRKTIIDLATGKAVYDAIVAKSTPYHLWATASRDGGIYTFDEVTMELLEETFKDGALQRVSARTLEGEDLSLSSEYWGKRSVLFVSKPADKVLLLPSRYTDGQAHNEAYVWQLSTGKLLYRSPNLVRPHAAYLAKLNAPLPPPAAPVTIGANMLVQTGGRLYHLRELSYSKQWVAFALTKNRHGQFERQDVTRPENFFAPGNTRVVSITACPTCAGGGVQKVNELRTTETEAKMIYNTLVTTKTANVQVDQSCAACKGSGFQF